MSDRFQFYLNIDNRTSEHVRYLHADFVDGEEAQDPVVDVLPQRNATNAFVASGKSWSPFGTEGTVFFEIGSDQARTFSIYWNISSVPRSTNKVTIQQTGDARVSLQGFHGGSNEVVSCTAVVTEG